MKKPIFTVEEFSMKVGRKFVITAAVIAGITFFFNPVPECDNTARIDYQEPVMIHQHYNSQSIDFAEGVSLYPNDLDNGDDIIEQSVADMFESTFKESCKDLNKAYPVFKDMLPQICSLPIDEGYADYGNNSGNIHFNMFLNDDLRLTIDKNIYNLNDKVAFSLSVGSDMLALDEMQLNDVIDIVNKLLS